MNDAILQLIACIYRPSSSDSSEPGRDVLRMSM